MEQFKCQKNVYVNKNYGLSGIVNARTDLFNECDTWTQASDRETLQEYEDRNTETIYALQNLSGKMQEVTRKTALKHL